MWRNSLQRFKRAASSGVRKKPSLFYKKTLNPVSLEGIPIMMVTKDFPIIPMSFMHPLTTSFIPIAPAEALKKPTFYIESVSFCQFHPGRISKIPVWRKMPLHASLEKNVFKNMKTLLSLSLGDTFSLSAEMDFTASSLLCRGVEVLKRGLLLSGGTAVEL